MINPKRTKRFLPRTRVKRPSFIPHPRLFFDFFGCIEDLSVPVPARHPRERIASSTKFILEMDVSHDKYEVCLGNSH